MPVLGLDTATLVSGVALATENKLLAEITIQTRKTHSELLMPHVSALLDMAEINKKNLEGVAVSIGPGSFTGLRIGLATAKALAYALQIPLVGVSTLAALAYSCPLPGILLAPMLDSQKGNVYLGLYRWNQDTLEEVMAAQVLSFEEGVEVLAAYEQPVLPLGEAAAMYQEKIKALGGPFICAAPHIIMPRAACVALLGQELIQKGIRHDIMNLEPLYIRRSEAEVLWEKRHGGACV